MHGPLASRSESALERLFRALLDPATSRTHYLAAAAVVVIWLMLAWGLHPWLGDRGSFLIFIPAVLFAAGFGGLGPGLLATALSVTLGVLLVGARPPHAARDARDHHLRHRRRRHLLVRRAASPHAHSRPEPHARSAGARSASPLDPRHRSRRDGRHRREGHHPIVQRGRRAIVRLYRSPASSARTSAC